MNQILDYNPNGNSAKRGGSGNSDKIVKIFAIILIIFAIALIVVVAYGRFSNQKEISNEAENITYANIEVEKNDQGATIKVTHDKNMEKMIYSWNTSTERSVIVDGKYVEETIDVPAGDNTLHIKIIDENGVETTHDEEISSENGIDIINPVIDLSVTEDKKLSIKATDETGMDYITYRWNDEEEQTVEAESEDSKQISTEIEILKGENDLTIIAVDTSNNTTTETKSFTGLTKPEITVTLSEDGSNIDIKATHEKGIESVKYNFNNEDYTIDIGNENPTEFQFTQPLEIGYNRIILTVKSVDGTETTFDGECNYGNEQSPATTTEESATEEDTTAQESEEDETTEESNNE